MKVLLTGGGTGGHIYPALSLWQYMKEHVDGLEARYIGTRTGLEQSIVTKTELPFDTVEAAGLRRQISVQAFKTFVKTGRGYFQARRLLKRHRPDVVVGTGGFVTLPVVFAAHSLGIPNVIWEGNAIPGLTNKWCAKRTNAVAISFQDSARYFAAAPKVVLTGNPRASEVLHVPDEEKRAARDEYRILRGQKVVVLYSGSRGSESVNQVITSLLPRFAAHPDWRVLYVTGDKHYDEATKSLGEIPHNVTIHPYIYNMPSVLAQTDLVISRSGSSTLAEICALGIASILIPSPYVTANHQEENAKQLVEQGAAAMIPERDLNADALYDKMIELLQDEKLKNMRSKAKSTGTPNAVQDLFQLVCEVVSQGK